MSATACADRLATRGRDASTDMAIAEEHSSPKMKNRVPDFLDKWY